MLKRIRINQKENDTKDFRFHVIQTCNVICNNTLSPFTCESNVTKKIIDINALPSCRLLQNVHEYFRTDIEIEMTNDYLIMP